MGDKSEADATSSSERTSRGSTEKVEEAVEEEEGKSAVAEMEADVKDAFPEHSETLEKSPDVEVEAEEKEVVSEEKQTDLAESTEQLPAKTSQDQNEDIEEEKKDLPKEEDAKITENDSRDKEENEKEDDVKDACKKLSLLIFTIVCRVLCISY